MKSSKLPSLYAPNELVTPAQYITELICRNKAKAAKKVLPNYFWKQPVWNRHYRLQIIAANALLKIYELKHIIAALNDRDAYYIFSLRSPKLVSIIEQYKFQDDMIKLASQEQPSVSQNIEKPETDASARPSFNPNKRKKL